MSLSESIFTMTKHGCFELVNPLNMQKEQFEFNPSDPKSYDLASQRLKNRKSELISDVAKRIGREPSAREMMQRFVDASQDSRRQLKRCKIPTGVPR